ncbi:MAG: enoyl-CoA hydratase/isomerase family protein [bacterium]
MQTHQQDFENILVTRRDHVAIVAMNRPDKLNALSPALIRGLIGALRMVMPDDEIRAVVLTGEGRAFSAGGDIEKDVAPLSRMNPTEFERYMGQAPTLYRLLIDARKPVVGALNGHVVGAGLDLAVACDFRIASEDAQLGLVFVKMGLAAEVSLYLLPRLIGLSRTKRLAFTGAILKAHEAERIGLVDEVVPAAELMRRAEAFAEELAQGPVAIGITKQIIHQSLRMDLDGFLDYMVQRQYQLFHTEDHREAVQAWMERRKPAFQWR